METPERKMGKKMPFSSSGTCCAVADCYSTYTKAKLEGIQMSFHKFPVKAEIRKLWVMKCKRGDKFNPNNYAICSRHFDESDFQRDLKAELLGLKPKRFLKPGVIPHVNIPLDPNAPKTPSALRRQARYKQKTVLYDHKMNLAAALGEEPSTSIKSQKKNKMNCCVVGCRNSYRNTKRDEVRFFRFPGREYEHERRVQWIQAVNRENADGSPWVPSINAIVCSKHFIGGRPSNVAGHPDYVPSVFPDQNCVRLPKSNSLRRHKWPAERIKSQKTKDTAWILPKEEQETCNVEPQAADVSKATAIKTEITESEMSSSLVNDVDSYSL